MPTDSEILWMPAVPDDAAELSSLFNEIADFDGTPERWSPETMHHELTSAFEPLAERTMIARSTAGKALGYATVQARDDAEEEQRAYVWVHARPSTRGQGLEDALIDWAVDSGRAALARSPAARKYVCTWLYKQQENLALRYEQRGFEPVRHWWEMERFLAQDIASVSEEGFTVVPWEEEHNEATRLLYNASFADHWGSSAIEADTWRKEKIESPGFRPDLSCVAVVGDQPVGYAYNEIYEEDWEAAGRSEAWISSLGVLREWRKRGIATALLTRSMAAMRAAGLEVAMIMVDSASPSGAQHLYRAVGFGPKSTAVTWQKEVG